MKFSKIPREIKIAEFKNSEGMVLYRSEKRTIAFIAFRFSPQYFYSSIKTTLSETTETGVIQSKTAISQLISNLMNSIMRDIGGCISVIEDLYFNLEISLETGDVDFCFKLEGDSFEDVQRKKLFLEEKLKNYINLDALVPLLDEFLLNFYFKSINTTEIKSINIEKIENSKLLKIYHRDFEDKTTTFHLFIHFNKKIEEINANTISQMLNSLRAFGINGFLNIYIQLGKKALFETQYFLQLFGKSKKFKEHVDIVLNQTSGLKYCTIHDPTVFDMKDLIWRRIPEGGIIRFVNFLNLEEDLILKQFLQTYQMHIDTPSFQKIYNFEDKADSKYTFGDLIPTPPQYDSKTKNHGLSETFEQENPLHANHNIGWNENKQQESASVSEITEWDQSLAQINQMIETNEYLEYDNEINPDFLSRAMNDKNYWNCGMQSEKNLPFIDEQLNIPMVPEKKSNISIKTKRPDNNLINAPLLNKNPKEKSSIALPPKPSLPPTTIPIPPTNSSYPKPNLSPLSNPSAQRASSRTPQTNLNLLPSKPEKRDEKAIQTPQGKYDNAVPPKPTLQEAPITPPPKPKLPPIKAKSFSETENIPGYFDIPQVPPNSTKDPKTIDENSMQEVDSDQDLIDKTFKFESFEELIQPKENYAIEKITQALRKIGLSFRKINDETIELPTLLSYVYMFSGDSLRPLIRTIWDYKEKMKNLIIVFEDHKTLVKYYHRIGLTKYPFIYAFITEKFTEDALRMLKLTNKRVSAEQII